MDIAVLVNLSRRAWALPILAALAAGVPGRQAALVAHTGAPRAALRESLLHLISLGYLRRSTGHGHPLRPEFALTDKGAVIAHRAAQALDVANRSDAGMRPLRRAWTVPILAASPHPLGFGALRAAVAGISDRALSEALKGLEPIGWVERALPDRTARPLRATYRATGPGREIAECLLCPG